MLRFVFHLYERSVGALPVSLFLCTTKAVKQDVLRGVQSEGQHISVLGLLEKTVKRFSTKKKCNGEIRAMSLPDNSDCLDKINAIGYHISKSTNALLFKAGYKGFYSQLRRI